MTIQVILAVLWLGLAILALALLFRTKARVVRSLTRYKSESNRSRLSGSRLARLLLDSAGLPLVPIEEIDGDLTDYYDLRHRAVCLTTHVLHESSVAAIGIATHEVGHALQHQAGYWPLRLRAALVSAVVLLPPIGFLLTVAGILLSVGELSWAGTAAIIVAIGLAFALLPIERDASRRGLELLERQSIAHSEDAASIRAVLAISPLTYLTLVIAAFGQLAYLGLRAAGISRKSD